MKAQLMETAPVDGTRILIKTQVWHYQNRDARGRGGEYVKAGTQWIECRFHQGKFIEWCGNERTQTTGSIDPICWAPVPEEA